jgi:DNA invertase Pin-like site-specific DNA recombinase
MSTTPKRAAAYTRISQDRMEGAGVARQQEDCRALIAERGWDLVGVYEDNDVSASSYSRKRRPKYRELLEQIEAGNVDVVVAYHPKRLVRRVGDLESLIELAASTGCKFVFVATDIPLDLNSANGRAMAYINVALGAMESEETSERVQRARLQVAREGGRTPRGGRPFGYLDGGMALHPGESAAIREAVAAILSGGASISSVTKTWNERGLRSPQGHAWTLSKVAKLLRQPSLAGLRHYGRTGETFPAQWPAIISADEHELLKRRTRQSSGERPTGRRGLLSGLLACGVCQTRLMYSRTSVTAYRYRCEANWSGGCGAVQVAQGRALEDALLDLVAMNLGVDWVRDLAADGNPAREALVARVDSLRDRLPDPAYGPEREAILKELLELDDHEAMLVDMLNARELRRDEFARSKQQTAERRRELDAALRTTGSAVQIRFEDLERLVDVWKSGDRDLSAIEVDELRAAVKATLPRGVAYITPGVRFARSFDPLRIALEPGGE